MDLHYDIHSFNALTAWYNFILCALPSCELSFNDFSSFNVWFSYKIVLVRCYLFHCALYCTFSPVNLKFLCLCVKDVCRMCEMKMKNLLVDVEICSLCRKETGFQTDFQQYKEKSWPSFFIDKLWPDIFLGFFVWGFLVLRGLCSRTWKSNVWTGVAVQRSRWSTDDTKLVQFFRIHMLLMPCQLVLVLQCLTNLSFMVLSSLVRMHDRPFLVHLMESAISWCLYGDLCNLESTTYLIDIDFLRHF